jgi:hypothetical protein
MTEPTDDEIHWHLYPGDDVLGKPVLRAGIYRIYPDGTFEDWGPVAPEDRCKYCLAEFAKAVAP